jgi:tetratricopeptide (TPR) repeat protein
VRWAEGALAELELARQSLPNDSRVLELIGYIQRRQPGRYEEGTRTLEHAIELDPRNTMVLSQIAAMSYRRLRRYADAKSTWDRLLAIIPDNVEAKASRAKVDLDWKGDTRPCIKRSIQFGPQIPLRYRASPVIGSFAHWPNGRQLPQKRR